MAVCQTGRLTGVLDWEHAASWVLEEEMARMEGYWADGALHGPLSLRPLFEAQGLEELPPVRPIRGERVVGGLGGRGGWLADCERA